MPFKIEQSERKSDRKLRANMVLNKTEAHQSPINNFVVR